MRIEFEEVGNDVVFRVCDFENKYEDILKMCFYQRDGKGYIKQYPAQTRNIERIKRHYFENAMEMFSQLGYFRPVPWEKALLDFLEMVDGAGIDWWLTGSCAACIRGVPLNPHDIDVMIDSKDIDKINNIFSDYIIEPIVDTKGWLTRDFGVIFMHARIDIASDPQERLDDPVPVDCGPYAKRNLEDIIWNGYSIKVPPVELQINVNKLRGRAERVQLLEEYLFGLDM